MQPLSESGAAGPATSSRVREQRRPGARRGRFLVRSRSVGAAVPKPPSSHDGPRHRTGPMRDAAPARSYTRRSLCTGPGPPPPGGRTAALSPFPALLSLRQPPGQLVPPLLCHVAGSELQVSSCASRWFSPAWPGGVHPYRHGVRSASPAQQVAARRPPPMCLCTLGVTFKPDFPARGSETQENDSAKLSQSPHMIMIPGPKAPDVTNYFESTPCL
jgi:hypothetical protein